MVLCRPHIYITAPARHANATVPITIPTIGPGPSSDDFDEDAAVVVAADVEEVVATGVGVIVAPVAVVVRDTGPVDSTGD